MKLRSVILDSTVRVVFDAALVLSVYFLAAGHNQPGGGFVGGLVAASAIALRYVSGGLGAVTSIVRVRSSLLLSLGLLLAGVITVWPLFASHSPLDQRVFEWTVPLLGDVKLTTATIFDTGVYLIVVGLVLMTIEHLADDASEADSTPSADTPEVTP